MDFRGHLPGQRRALGGGTPAASGCLRRAMDMDMQTVDLVAGRRCRFTPDPQALDLDPAEFSDIQIDVHVVLEGGNLVLSVAASADAHLACDRTLDAYSTRVSGSCRILLQPDGAEASEHGYDEAIVLQPLQRQVDVASVARDTLVLAVPARKVAPRARDIDLQREFGAPEPTIAQHWAPLRHLHSDF